MRQQLGIRGATAWGICRANHLGCAGLLQGDSLGYCMGSAGLLHGDLQG